MKIQRLNMDNSWHIDFAGNSILIDPWLKGVEVDFFSWFNTQWHRTPPIAMSDVPDYDFVIITQKYPDHYHPETLIELQPKKLIVPTSIEKKVKKLLPDAKVWTLENSSSEALGGQIKLHYLPTRRKMDPIYDAIVLENGTESILLATHGYAESEEWAKYLKNIPPIKLAFTPFNLYRLPSFLGGTVSPGLSGVKKLINTFLPKHIIATHDEDKHAKGLIQKLAHIKFAPSRQELIKEDLFKNRLLTIDNYQSITI